MTSLVAFADANVSDNHQEDAIWREHSRTKVVSSDELMHECNAVVKFVRAPRYQGRLCLSSRSVPFIMSETCRERGADEGQMLEFIRHLAIGERNATIRVTVGAVTIDCVRQNFADVMARTAAPSPSLALD